MTLLSPDPEQDDLQSEDSRYGDMTWISGGTFRMGSDRHYPEEAPVHRVTVDCLPIMNGWSHTARLYRPRNPERHRNSRSRSRPAEEDCCERLRHDHEGLEHRRHEGALEPHLSRGGRDQ